MTRYYCGRQYIIGSKNNMLDLIIGINNNNNSTIQINVTVVLLAKMYIVRLEKIVLLIGSKIVTHSTPSYFLGLFLFLFCSLFLLFLFFLLFFHFFFLVFFLFKVLVYIINKSLMYDKHIFRTR